MLSIPLLRLTGACVTQEATNHRGPRVALIILFNHRFDSNLPILDRLYRNRFSRVTYLVPFYDGQRPDVAPVYEHSYQFQGYVAQGLRQYQDSEVSHYVFIGDDLLLNPAIDESNILDYLGIGCGQAFLPGFIELHTCTNGWPRVREAYEYDPRRPGVEVTEMLPSVEQAAARLRRHGLRSEPVGFDQVFGRMPWPTSLRQASAGAIWLRRRIRALRTRGRLPLRYPIVGGYSDIFAVPAEHIATFCQLAGAFAATRLFVELAIPTALALSVEKIRTERDLEIKGKAMWTEEDRRSLEQRFENRIELIADRFPADTLYLHPVKLSKFR